MRVKKMNAKEMIKYYYPYSGLDWLNYQIKDMENFSDVTYHHIIPKREHSKKDMKNGALLVAVSHQYLHLIEQMEIETFDDLNKILKDINTQKREPYHYQREDIEGLLQDFEDRHRWEKNKEGVLLIKKKYLKRW